MQSSTTNFILISAVVYLSQVNSDDPCNTAEYIDNWQRSVAFGTDATLLCDNILAEGWYRVTSDAGELMPKDCPVGGFRCNTAKPIYLYTDNLPASEEPYPAVGVTVTRTAYASNYDGNYDLQDIYKYKIRWYINEIEIEDAKLEDLSKTDLKAGLGRMLEEHWTSKHKPNMLVTCAIQIGGDDFETYGPQNHSEVFFTGLKIDSSTPTEYQVLEGQELDIPVELTMPLSCAWPKHDTQRNKDNIKQNSCLLVLLNGVPDYQVNEEECVNGITADGIVFISDLCGIKFSHSNWKEKQTIKIFGQTDQLVNVQDRIIFLRLYNGDKVEPSDPILYWKNIHLPDIKVYVKDADVLTLGKSCYSHNDPHMRTFDQSYYELQIHNGLTEGEYIMYKHDRLPLQITLPTGTKVTFNYGYSYVDGINIIPSVLDTGMTKGLCGIYNGNANDDFTPRDELTAVTSIETFASSWKVTGDYANETLFDPNGVLMEIEYSGQQYCTCVSPDVDYPHGSPEFNCELTAALKPCRETKTTPGVYTADCKTVVTDYEREDEKPPSYPMIAGDNT
ncbi:unnamed protein product [Mytilus edulis]|uniref:VWFD domain-containing protein n=1 Tax=Mytilus edulis TaxID=6550 RepID=A0A8S3S7P4_MYTED|nr:unnamed protein product [Mytilus edulis]